MKYEGTKLPNFEPIDSVKELEVIDVEGRASRRRPADRAGLSGAEQ